MAIPKKQLEESKKVEEERAMVSLEK